MNENNERMAHVTLVSVREPQVGDKFATSHAQKGTMGASMRQEDLPFTRDGITPDIIINPHCIPSRMTIGQLIEMIGGMCGAILGTQLLGTPFIEYAATERKYSGITFCVTWIALRSKVSFFCKIHSCRIK